MERIATVLIVGAVVLAFGLLVGFQGYADTALGSIDVTEEPITGFFLSGGGYTAGMVMLVVSSIGYVVWKATKKEE